MNAIDTFTWRVPVSRDDLQTGARSGAKKPK